jgi:selenide, water dikinase
MLNDLRLTQTVQKGGCAAKVAAQELKQILALVRFPPADKNLLVDSSSFDDAAIYKVTEEIALVQTLDFFTPVVDSANLFGRIAAANALSDVYAMGGTPKTAMAILAFPLGQLSNQIIAEILQGASDVMAEAQVNFVGGHSIDDDTLKFGLSVTGYVHPQKVWSNAKAKSNDVLLLTKPLGTGTATAGLKRGELTESDIHPVLASMAQINAVADLLSENLQAAIHSATDVTGFGLAGHSQQMAQASKKTLVFDFNKLPVFEVSWKTLQKGFLTKAHRTNASYTEKENLIEVTDPVRRQILFDPQTSGGLLLSVAPEKAGEILQSLRQRFPMAAIIGRVQDFSAHRVIVHA